MATLHTLSMEKATTGARLGPVPKAKVKLEGETVEALLDTRSPGTIVALEYQLEVLAKRRPPTQTPKEWQEQTKQRLEPTTVVLRNYGGGQLPILCQIRLVLARADKECCTGTERSTGKAPSWNRPSGQAGFCIHISSTRQRGGLITAASRRSSRQP